MEALLFETPEIEGRREHVAEFIQDSLQLVKNILEDGGVGEVSEEIRDEVEDFQILDHQLDAWSTLWNARQAGADRALVHMATGLGKTSVGVFDVVKFYEEFRAKYDREPHILVTCHQNEIIEQAAKQFEAFIPDLSQGFYTGTRKDRDGDITFATLQSLYGSLDTFDPEEFDYIVYDEAHHSKAETFEEVVNHFNPKFQLALTATPDRLDQLDIRELFGEELYSKGLAQALAEGLLVEPDYHIVFDDAVKEALDTDFSPKSLKELRTLLDVWPRNELIADNVQEEMKKLGLELGKVKSIVFCHDIMHAEDMAWLLDGEAYHSDLSPSRRRELLRQFRDGDLQTICVRDMFNEGIDIPDAEMVVFLRSTSSATVFEQQLGRGLRKHEGKEKVTVLDFAANIERILMIQELAKEVRESIPQDLYSLGENSSSLASDPEAGTGLHIHTAYGDFDFDKIAVNLLERYSEIRANLPRNWSELSDEAIVDLALEISPSKPLLTSDLDELSKRRLLPHSVTIMQRFGGIGEFQRACGFEVDDRLALSSMTNEEIIERVLALSPDEPLSYGQLHELSKERGLPGPANIIKRFGSIKEFQEACGFESDLLRRRSDLAEKSDDELIELAKRLSPDKPLVTQKINALSKNKEFVSTDTIKKRFGSVPDFQEACGFSGRTLYRLDDDEIIELAKHLSPREPLTTDDVIRLSREGKFPGLGTIRTRFGRIRDLQRACGFDV